MCAYDSDLYSQVGTGIAEVIIPITMLLVGELNVKGSFRYGVSFSSLLSSQVYSAQFARLTPAR